MKEHVPFNRLSEYHDGALVAEEKERIAAHLRQCPECARDLEELGHLVKMIASLKCIGIRCSESFVRDAMSLIRRRKRLFYFKRFLPAAAAAALVLFVIGIDRFQDSPVRREERVAVTSMERDVSAGDEIGAGTEVREISSSLDVRKTISLLQNSGATIVSISDSSIEGEIAEHEFEYLRGQFEANRGLRRNGAGSPVGLSASDPFTTIFFSEHGSLPYEAEPRMMRFKINFE